MQCKVTNVPNTPSLFMMLYDHIGIMKHRQALFMDLCAQIHIFKVEKKPFVKGQRVRKQRPS